MTLSLVMILAVQTREGEATLRAMEEKLLKSSSTSIRYTVTSAPGQGPNPGLKVTGSLLLRGDQVNATMNIALPEGKASGVSVQSDGTRLRVEKDGATQELSQPKDLGRRLALGLVRGGVALSLQLLPSGMFDPAECLSVSEVQVEKGLLSYKLVLRLVMAPGAAGGAGAAGEGGKGGRGGVGGAGGPGGTLEIPITVKLWYDPETLALKKRLMTSPMGEGTEEYEDYSLGASLSDEQFKLPARK